MNDGYDGDTTESGTETGSETTETTTDTAPESSLTETETSTAFDEGDGTTSETETETETETPTTTDVPDKTDGIGEEEVADAFDEKDPNVTKETDTPDVKTETKTPDVKTETETGKPDVKQENADPAAAEKADNSEVTHMKCIRDDLAGKEHPETGVPYVTKVVEVNGKQVEVTVPEFKSDFDLKLEEDQLLKDRDEHRAYCNEKLKEYCEQNPEWAKEHFNEEQLSKIEQGKTPTDYVWHHDGGEVGHMQLVDEGIHSDTRHTGGIAIWGNTSKFY